MWNTLTPPPQVLLHFAQGPQEAQEEFIAKKGFNELLTLDFTFTLGK